MVPYHSLQQVDRGGVLLVGHGTRDTAGVAEFLAVAQLIAEKTEQPLEACFLELAEPTIAEAVDRLVARGVRNVVVVPLLLFAAGHAQRDIPTAVAEAVARHPELTVRQTAALECNEHILALSARRFREAIAGREPVAGEQTLLLMVGRGSSSADATAEMRRFLRLRGLQSPVGRALVCFVAMQAPSLATGLAEAAASEFRRIVVQPHLLFSGQLYDEIRTAVKEQAARETDFASDSESPRPAREWIVTAPLGPEPELVAGVISLVASVKGGAGV